MIVHSLHWKNISQSILNDQRMVFETLNIPLHQNLVDLKDHGEWMMELTELAANDEVLVFCDIDAFPINPAGYNRAVEFAKSGGIFGLAQFSNHTLSNDLYAGPMFLSFRKSVWVELGKPSLRATTTADAGELLSIRAREADVPLMLVMPTSCIKPKWGLANRGVFGVGTFYGDNDFFHLFESRMKSSVGLFRLVASDVINGRPLDFNSYLGIYKRDSVYAWLSKSVLSLRFLK